jgi:hypothetical protein
LTAARTEYSTALRADAAALNKIFDHAPETKGADLSRRQEYVSAKNYATDFATELFCYETTRFVDITMPFS